MLLPLLLAASAYGFQPAKPALMHHRRATGRQHLSPRLAAQEDKEWTPPPGLEPDAIVLLWYYGCATVFRSAAYRFQISGLPWKKLNELGWDFPALSQVSTHPPSSPRPSRAHAITCTACRCACCIAPCEVSSLANQALGGAAALAWTWVLG